MVGQINLGSVLGEALLGLARDPYYHNFVEIGTWNGEGSTRCLMQGILPRSDGAKLWSLEADRDLHRQAVLYWEPYRLDGKLELIHGTIAGESDMMTQAEVRGMAEGMPAGLPNTVHDYLGWWRRDREVYRSAPNVLHRLPDRIDVLLLDGGEFTTYAEFFKLRDRAQVVALDDARLFKGRRVRREILADACWQILLDDPDERHGITVAARSR